MNDKWKKCSSLCLCLHQFLNVTVAAQVGQMYPPKEEHTICKKNNKKKKLQSVLQTFSNIYIQSLLT